LDVLILVNELNTNGVHEIGVSSLEAPFLDVNGDNMISALDVLETINYINSTLGGGAAGEGEAYVADAPVAEAVPAAAPLALDQLVTVEDAALIVDVPADLGSQAAMQFDVGIVDQYFASEADRTDEDSSQDNTLQLSVSAQTLPADAVQDEPLFLAEVTTDGEDLDDLLSDLAADVAERSDVVVAADEYFAQLG
jgi:hypothetical protein